MSASLNQKKAQNCPSSTLFSELLNRRLSRREMLAQSSSLLTAGLLSSLLPVFSQAQRTSLHSSDKEIKALGFQSVPFSTKDEVIVPEDYEVEVLYAWGDPTGIPGKLPSFRHDASNPATDQAVQAGMHHDGMQFFSLPVGSQSSKHGLLAINHEYIDPHLLSPDGNTIMTEEKYKKAVAAMGVSIIEVAKQRNGSWNVKRPSHYARRITADTPMIISGPAAGHPLMKTEADPTGCEVLGTLQNCSNGWTPWGTYLTCEENFNNMFCDTSSDSEQDFNKIRYGIHNKENFYKWNEIDPRWNRQLHPNEVNRFGWVVEIDPYHPKTKPVKRTALGRFKHEGATPSLSKDGRLVIYMGDDQPFEYIYKFVSSKPWNAKRRHANRHLLDEGTLYVALFNSDGSGEWRELSYGKNGLTQENGFENQGEVLIKTRLAADMAGATKMDRPERMAVNPANPGEIYCTLTNNHERGTDGKPDIDAANPRKQNVFGHIIRWIEAENDPASLNFQWNIFALAGRSDTDTPEHKMAGFKGDAFGSPDGLYYDKNGVLWIQTDVSNSTLNQDAYAGMGNNMMLATLPETGEVKRFLTGPNGCEITGISFTPDHKTVFINIQHPGESKTTNAEHPTAFSNWPDRHPEGRPRSATLMIRKKNGGVIGL